MNHTPIIERVRAELFMDGNGLQLWYVVALLTDGTNRHIWMVDNEPQDLIGLTHYEAKKLTQCKRTEQIAWRIAQ
jgi:hypothetical protein